MILANRSHATVRSSSNLSGSSSNMSGSTVTANNFFAFHTVLKTSEDYYEAMRWARRLADNISDTINRNVSGMYIMAILVMEFSRKDYKIRMVFG